MTKYTKNKKHYPCTILEKEIHTKYEHEFQPKWIGCVCKGARRSKLIKTKPLRCVHTYAALRCKCMLLLNAACDELRCAALRCAASACRCVHTYAALRCIGRAALRCFLKLLQIKLLLKAEKSCFSAFKSSFEAALLLMFGGVELHSADWLLKVC